ncbi:cytochrome P450 704C1-like [Cornus florida]|uniref:cytochrome P450 704C1-like n=1 Tax=Cornus florida TaxID=4283 RepID=UPI0028A20C04|nr:cytochrome P450 704C1-like [Cornus florida]
MDFLSNPISFTVTALAVIFVIYLTKFVVQLSSSDQKKRYYPVVATVFHQLLHFERLHDYMTQLSSRNKTYRLLDLSRSQICTADPAIVEYVLKTNFANYGKGWFHHSILMALLGDGIHTVDGGKWQHQRKISSYEFSTKMLRDFSSVVFRNNAVKLAGIVSKAATSNQTIEVQDIFMKSTLDAVFKVILGAELDSMCGTNEEGALFSKAFDEASAITVYRYVDVFWRINRFLNIGSEAKMRESIKVIDRFVYKFIRSKTEQGQELKHDSSMIQTKKVDLVSRLLEANETDPKYLKDFILSFIIAGKDTTAVALSWFFYMICKYPLIQEKIAQEVKEATQMDIQNSSFEEFANGITEDAVNKMHYLHATLTETLRLYPAVPVDAKVCFSDDTFPDGFSVRKGDMITYQPYCMGRMKSLWGDDAEEFRPERWLDKDGIFQQESPFKLTAFQAGPRICLGKEFAYREMKIFSAMLMGNFIFKLSDEQGPVNYKTMLTLHIDGGLHLCASHRWACKSSRCL